jgi:hypothetical protein
VATKSHWRSLFAKMQQRLSRRVYVTPLARLGNRRMHVSPAVGGSQKRKIAQILFVFGRKVRARVFDAGLGN